MPRIIPLVAQPSQTLAAILDGQAVQLAFRQNGDNLFMDVRLDGEPIVLTRVCRDRQLILLDARYHGFKGDFIFLDTQGSQQPNYLGLAPDGRYLLAYLSEAELP